jgi:Fur family transcriptional regulator, stress-responsive regulator
MVGVVQTPEILADEFRARGWKVTAQRRLLFSLLHDTDRHPTADALFAAASERMPGISRRTVYQTLAELAELGELRVVRLDGGPARFDPNLDDHHHARCTVCDAVFDVYVAAFDAAQIAGPVGFSTTSAHLILSGVCASCAPVASDSIHPSPTPSPTTSATRESS